MNIRQILSVMRQHIVIILVIAVAFALIGAWVSSREATVWRATALVHVPDPTAPIGGPLSSPTVRDRDILTTVEAFSTFPIEESDLTEAGLDLTTDQAQAAITLAPVPGTDLIQITVTGTSAEDIEALAGIAGETFAAALNAERSAEYRELAEKISMRMDALSAEVSGSPEAGDGALYLGLARMVLSDELASAERGALVAENSHRVVSVSKAAATSSDPLRGGIFGLAAGLLVGCAIAYWWYAAGDTRPARSVRSDLEAPVLATLEIDCAAAHGSSIGPEQSAAVALTAERLGSLASAGSGTLVLASLADPACAEALAGNLARAKGDADRSLAAVLGSFEGATTSAASTVVASLSGAAGASAVDALRKSAASAATESDTVLIASPWLAQTDETALLSASAAQLVLLAPQTATRARVNACIDSLAANGVDVVGVITLLSPKRRASDRH